MTFAAGFVFGVVVGILVTIGYALLCGNDDDWRGA